MATSPISGALSPTQLAVIEQIRALRAAKPVAPSAPVQTAAPAQAAAPVVAKPAAAAPLDRTATITAADPPPANRPRGSILNIVI